MKWCHSFTLYEAMKAERVAGHGPLLCLENEEVCVDDALPRGIMYDDADPEVERVKKIRAEKRAREEVYRRAVEYLRRHRP